jgi:hypothetical protein
VNKLPKTPPPQTALANPECKVGRLAAFDPLWKLLYMWEHPYHFPLAAWTAVSGWAGRLWQELIGIAGWQDILLQPWTYLVLTVLLDTDHVRGVQGRYFVVALPVIAIFIAAVVNRELPRGMPAVIAIAGSMIAGITTVEAVLRAHW